MRQKGHMTLNFSMGSGRSIVSSQKTAEFLHQKAQSNAGFFVNESVVEMKEKEDEEEDGEEIMTESHY